MSGQMLMLNNSAIRLVTSWATKEDAVLAFIEDMKNELSK